MVQVVWFKRDLRTIDHRPLAEAASAGALIPLYVVEPGYWALPDTSRRQWCAIRGALTELAERLGMLGAPLILRKGNIVEILERIHGALGITRLLAHEETGNGWTYARDLDVHRFCRAMRIPFMEYPQFGVVRRLQDRDLWGQKHADFLASPLIPEPDHLLAGTQTAPGAIPTAEDLHLAPDGCLDPQSGTRREALRLLDGFFAGRGKFYRHAMSNPLEGANSCSRLSVSVATGAISIREILAGCKDERAALRRLPQEARSIPLTAIDSLVSRLHWHCHFIQKLESEPEIEVRSLHPAHEKARMLTTENDPTLEAWATGQTGLPFVDACMRSLIATGWLNFRMRAMLQCVATYHLGLDWRASGLRLARLFTDYEPGIHWPQVQMQAGQTGINTPRIYNPVKQGLDQDPRGIFTRRWVPELARVPLAVLQMPWTMDSEAQGRAHCLIGKDYPAPIVDPVIAIRAARERLRTIRLEPGYQAAAKAVYLRHGSRQRRLDDDNPAKQRALLDQRRDRSARQLSLDL
jgi:deoxyribodipyrimidine photo-lyase